MTTIGEFLENSDQSPEYQDLKNALHEEGFELVLEKKGKGLVTANDLKLPGFVEILNPELPLAHITFKELETRPNA